jgi:quercetin dioxygenase-like cupin family protein
MFTSNSSVFISTEEPIMKFGRLGILCSLLAGLIAIAPTVRAQEKGAESHGIVRSSELKWTPLIKGCDLAAVSGDPNGEGVPFVVRLRCTAGAVIPAHWHPTDENVTVLKGTFMAGMGDKFDASKLQLMNVGSFVDMPKDVRHFAQSKTDSIVQVHGVGPFKVNWVNPADVLPPDAPKKKSAAARP